MLGTSKVTQKMIAELSMVKEVPLAAGLWRFPHSSFQFDFSLMIDNKVDSVVLCCCCFLGVRFE